LIGSGNIIEGGHREITLAKQFADRVNKAKSAPRQSVGADNSFVHVETLA
jgi:hypothetical protein